MIYRNPVYPDYFADPFVWRTAGRYYAVGTGPIRHAASPTGSGREDGSWRAFPLLCSPDLVHWEYRHGALKIPDGFEQGDFWAPEVAECGGLFYLYYSVAITGLNHVLRVARSDRPEGPYEDCGPLMKQPDLCPFAIDAHPFRDADGQWYLFYARDFLDVTERHRAGTALVVDRLESMIQLAGEESVVLRATLDWQLFQASRPMYGRVFDWHTLEGPFVRLHEGRYYCFYSGGCFENETYGVDYAVSQFVRGPYDASGAENGPRVLRSVPPDVIGPGHQSIVEGPDHRDYFVFHAWDACRTARRMCIDPLEWTPEGPRCRLSNQPLELLSSLHAGAEKIK